MPPLTRTLGPTFTRVSAGPQLSDLAYYRLLFELIAKLPDVVGFEQTFDPQCNNLLAFQVSGFSIEAHYTFRLQNCCDLGEVWKGLRDKTRNEIRRSQEHCLLDRSSDISTFVESYEANLRRSGKSMIPERGRMKKILDAAVNNDAGESMLCRTVPWAATCWQLYLLFGTINTTTIFSLREISELPTTVH
jgi:hypothetical protein